MIRLFLAEDQTLLLGALARLLQLEPDIELLGQASDGSSARQGILDQLPDMVLSDIEMPGLTGLELAEWLQHEQPQVKVVILTTFARPGYLRRALEAGVRGYLLKDTPAGELALTAFDSKNPLNERERQILRLAGSGLGNFDIGQQLHLAEGTVRNYLSEAISKLNANNRIEAYRIARDQGWL